MVDDVQKEYKLKDKRITFLLEPFEIITGTAAEFEDPSGNRLGITDYTKTEDSPYPNRNRTLNWNYDNRT